MNDELVCFYDAKQFYYKNVVLLLTGSIEFAKVRAYALLCLKLLRVFVHSCLHALIFHVFKCLQPLRTSETDIYPADVKSDEN